MVTSAEAKKSTSYAELARTHHVVPLAIETSGVFGPGAMHGSHILLVAHGSACMYIRFCVLSTMVPMDVCIMHIFADLRMQNLGFAGKV